MQNINTLSTSVPSVSLPLTNKDDMKKLLFLILFFPFFAYAQETPEQVLEKIIADIKAASSTSPVVEYVDWEKAFNNMPEERRKMISVETPAAMKSYYKEVLKDPVSMMRKQFEARLDSLPPAQRPIYEQNFSRMQKALEDKTKEMYSRISETDYKIGTADIQGDVAVIALTQKYKEEEKTENVRFEKSGDKWMLPAVSSLGSQQPQKPATATP